jgi:pimeloyl-ACP methyl ester carboxylesterase
MGKHVAKEDVMPGDVALVKWYGASGYHIGFVAWVDKAKWTYGLLWGNQGNAVTIREEKIHNYVKKSHLEVILNGGHNIHRTHPLQVAQLIVNFIKEWRLRCLRWS